MTEVLRGGPRDAAGSAIAGARQGAYGWTGATVFGAFLLWAGTSWATWGGQR